MVDKNDVDALLGSLGNSEKSSEKPRETQVTEEQLGELGERAGSFKIDSRESYFTGTDKLRSRADALAADPKDFTDQLSKQRDNRQRKRILIGFGIVFFVLLLAAASYYLVQSITAQAVPTAQRSSEEQRFLNLFPNAPTADTSVATKLVATDNGLRIVDGYTLTFAGMEFETLDYQAIESTDFGPAAVAAVEGDWHGTTVYLFKDMAHSRAFVNAWNGEPTSVDGSPASAVMFMELSSGVHAVLAIVNPDSTGFMIVLPQNLNYESAKNLQNYVRIENIASSTEQSSLAGQDSFDVRCSPSYDTRLSTVLGKPTVSDNTVVNAVYSPLRDAVLVGVKFTDGQTAKLLYVKTEGFWWPATDQDLSVLQQRYLGDELFGDVFENLSPDESALVNQLYGAITSAPAYAGFDECLSELETPGEEN